MLNSAEAPRVNTTAHTVEARVQCGTILLVTSDGNLRAAAGRVLAHEGYDVVIARHAGHAFLAALTRTRIDVLISDLTLDDMSGAALATMLRRHHPSLRSLFIADSAARQSGRVLVRPFTRDELLDELSAIALTTT